MELNTLFQAGVLIAAVFAFMVFHRYENNRIMKETREAIRESEERTREEAREREERTRAEFQITREEARESESRLRGEIQASEERTRSEMKDGFAESSGKSENLRREVYDQNTRLSKLEARAELKDKAEQDKDAA